MNHKIKTGLQLLGAILLGSLRLSAQESSYSLQELIEAAKKNNSLIRIKEYQVQEKMSKLKENKIKQYPSAIVDGTYQYSFNQPEITIPAGSLGTIDTGNGQTQLLPSQASKFPTGQKGSYNVGLNFYQPVTQLFKINTGLNMDKVDIKLGQAEKEKTALELQLAIEQLYYGAIIAQKQTDATKAKLELAKSRLYDAQGALTTGKTIQANLSGLQAVIAGEEQNLLKIEFQLQDYLAELSRLTTLSIVVLQPQDEEQGNINTFAVNDYKNLADHNPDMEIARLQKEKAVLAIQAAKESNLPDFGLVAGYYVQQGSPFLPKNSPFAGLSLKWNLQDLFSNNELKNQRQFQLRQAEETITYTQKQVNSTIDQTWRKVELSQGLIASAKKLVGYRKDALKEQQDKEDAGLGIKTALLEAKSQLAEAETDLYTAKLSNTIAIAELRNLAGQTK
ncbi:outer membrane protein TolC [Flavobacterium araucananum]|uniref:Transporter n=1 Tax=Flavobacterium araucananum TaxID=946678 RepID=A0A227PCM4_9FLAO|nr:TolC family protein [Flavobacterium araucananum]OXG07124.1 hypothetical protein B0A64_09950 [Flavobacterium araucananum]PWK01337.1 outer membrane protein TolC [Flavobacterium araucananum]